MATAAAFTTPPSLVANPVTRFTATLTLAGHTGNWYVKQTAPTAEICPNAATTGATKNLNGLTANTSYTYKAYSDSGCTTEIATATFTTAVADPQEHPKTSRLRLFGTTTGDTTPAKPR